MWMRKRRESLAQDLYDTVAELGELEQELMLLSVELAQKGLKRASESTSRMVLTLQDREALLRKYAERLTQAEVFGRRASDHGAEGSVSSSSDASAVPLATG
jgi:hypothetical protein